MLSPPPTSHPFLVHVQNYGGRVPPILLDGCWQSTFTLFFLNLMTVLQLFSNIKSSRCHPLETGIYPPERLGIDWDLLCGF